MDRRLWTFLFAVATSGAGLAHPMGNFSVSHYTQLRPTAKSIEIHYVIDLAEIPTFELLRSWEIDRSAPRSVLDAKALAQARQWGEQLTVLSDGRALRLRLLRATATVADGAGSLPIVRVDSYWTVPAAGGHLEFEDHNFPDRAGWKEIVIAPGPGATVERASQDDKERSAGLTRYPPDPTVAPPQDLRAVLDWTAEAPLPALPRAVPRPVVARIPQPASPAPPPTPAALKKAPPAGAVVRGDSISRLLRGPLSPAVILIALAIAFGLGAAHALTPGHGKTLVAAYLVGSRGAMKHAVVLGAMVTFTHTITVFALGLATLFFFRFVAPERLTEALGVISGLAIVGTGGWMLWKRMKQPRPHAHHHHDHSHDHDHSHHDQGHDHVHAHAPAHDYGHAHPHEHPHTHSHDGHAHEHHHYVEGDITMGSLLALGASGGLVPCESALVLLLSAIALGRVGLGLMLLTAFSLGLAIVLVAIGMLVLYARHLLPERARNSRSGLLRWAPVASAAAIVLVGLLMTGVSLGLLKPAWLIG